jgi:hypothetical protein
MKQILTLFFLLPLAGLAQEIRNARLEIISNELISITYDLLPAREGERYDVVVYASPDNFTKPLTYVTGDVGTDIQPGEGKNISWKVQVELIDFEGNLTVEIRAKLAFSPLAFQRDVAAAKRGKSLPVEWSGARAGDQVRLELMQSDSVAVRSMATVNNTGFYTWQIPDDMSIGKTYRIRISDANNRELFALSNPFAIRRKIGWGLKLLPVAVIGGAAALILGGSSSSQGDPELPGPTAPPR